MTRGMDANYIGSLSLMGGYDMGINFDGFGEKFKKFMELPGQYLDAVHDTAIGLIEDVADLLDTSSDAAEMQRYVATHGTFKDASSENSVTRTMPTSIGMEPAAPCAEVSSLPTSLVIVDNDFLEGITSDANGSKSFAANDPASEDLSSEGDQNEALGQSMLQEATLITETFENYTSEESISVGETSGNEEEVCSCNSEDSIKPLAPEPVISEVVISDGEANTNEEMETTSLYNSVNSEPSASRGAILLGKNGQNEEERTASYISDNLIEATEHGDLMGSAGWNISDNLSGDVLESADDPNLKSNVMGVDLQDDRNDNEDHELVVSLYPQPKNMSFKKKIVRGLLSKFRWSKKTETTADQHIHIGSQEAEGRGQGAVSLPDDLESGWELL